MDQDFPNSMVDQPGEPSAAENNLILLQNEDMPLYFLSVGSRPAEARKFTKQIDKMGKRRYNTDKFSVKLC